MTAVLQLELDDDRLAKLNEPSRDTGRPVEELNHIALQEFLEDARKEVDETLEGMQDVAQGAPSPTKASSHGSSPTAPRTPSHSPN
jgi:predicted transcriptional regulator